MEHNFHGTSFTIGIEEELMIVDAETHELVNAIEELLAAAPAGQVKPELMESVLEIATEPCADIAAADADLRKLRDSVCRLAARHGYALGSAGTHPFALWEDQRIAARQRYRELISALRFVARQELIFGLHIHVGINGADKAIYVADGMRIHLPVLLALSANSPFWRGDLTGMASSRMPVFRQFPRVGIPPSYGTWEAFDRQIEFMVRSGTIADYTYLWYDVRPHPKLGTVEIRACDAQTRVEHTVGLAALIQAMVKALAEQFDAGVPLADQSWQMLDENRWLAARHGLDGELVDLPTADRVQTRTLAYRLLDRLREHAQDLRSEDQLEAVRDILSRGNGAHRQRVVYEANHDLREVIGAIVDVTGGGAEG